MQTTRINTNIGTRSKLLSSVAILAAALVAVPASAQSDYQRDYADSANQVTIYSDCGFRGQSQTVAPGDYRKMRGLGFANDSISSVRVPEGLELVIYENQKFRGAYARINRDIRCFDRQWDDKVSSLRVSGEAVRDSRGRRDDRYQSRGDERYDSRDRDARSRDGRRGNRDRYGERDSVGGGYEGRSYDNRGRDSRSRSEEQNVTAKNLAQVVFNRTVLQQIDAKQWRMNSPRGGVSQFKETRRDRDSVYLQNDYTAERVRIDLFANDVTFVNRDGRQQRYNIDRKQAALSSVPNRPDPRSARERNNLISGACFNYRAYTLGGDGGVRFHGKEGFYRFSKKPKTGRVCHSGDLTMEINKTSPATEVVIEIQGKLFRFAKNEKEDKYKNNWYRKLQSLVVGR